MGYKGLQEVTGGYNGSKGVTGGDKALTRMFSDTFSWSFLHKIQS